jgi:biopolymer transport protein ExbB/TolQ
MKTKLFSIVALMALVLSILGSSALAEPSRKKEGPVAKIRAILAELSLTDEQKTKIDPILADAESKLTELRDNAKAGTDEEKKAAREKGREIMKETVTKIMAELTEDQQKLAREKMKEMREKRDGPREGRGKGKGQKKPEGGEKK